MEVTIAREIIKRAKKDDIYEGAVPEDDATAITAAKELVEMAEQAWTSLVRGPEVKAILDLANNNQNGEESKSDSEDTGDDHAPPESESDASEGISGTPSPFRDLGAELAKTEPWEGYGDMTVNEVTEGVNVFMGDMEENSGEFQEILQNVWAFEAAHKNRKRILNHVIEAWKLSGGEIETEETTEESAGEPEQETEGVSSTTEGDAEGESDSDAPDDSGPEASAESGEAGTGEHAPEASEENQRGGSGGSGGGHVEQKIVEKIEQELARERADGIPKPPSEELPDLPWNWNEISDQALQNFLMQYSAWAFYKGYQRTKHERVAIHAKQAAEELTHAKRLQISNYDEKGKEKKVGLIEAEIAQDKSIKNWRRMQSKHERMSLAARQELDALHKMVESLSRLETMRHNAYLRGIGGT